MIIGLSSCLFGWELSSGGVGCTGLFGAKDAPHLRALRPPRTYLSLLPLDEEASRCYRFLGCALVALRISYTRAMPDVLLFKVIIEYG